MAQFIFSYIGGSLLEGLQYPWQPAVKSALREEKKSRLGRERASNQVTLVQLEIHKLQPTAFTAYSRSTVHYAVMSVMLWEKRLKTEKPEGFEIV